MPPPPPLKVDYATDAAYQHEWQHWKSEQMATKGQCECYRCPICWDIYQGGLCHCTRQKESA